MKTSISKNEGITFKWPLLSISILCLTIGAWQMGARPLTATEVFNAKRPEIKVSARASVWRPPRGIARIALVTTSSGVLYIDCLTINGFCQNEREAAVEADLIQIKSQFYWPRRLLLNGKKAMDEPTSRIIYELFEERERVLYKIWFALGLAFVAFGVWFRNRKLFPSSNKVDV